MEDSYHLSTKERVIVESMVLDLLDQYRTDDGGRDSYNDVIKSILKGDLGPCERLGCTKPAVDLGFDSDTFNTKYVCEDHSTHR